MSFAVEFQTFIYIVDPDPELLGGGMGRCTYIHVHENTVFSLIFRQSKL